MAILNMFRPGRRRRRASPTQTLGVHGTAVYGGYPQTEERNRDLASPDARYRTYSDIVLNTSIVAAGVRYFLNLISKSKWSFTPAEADIGGRFAEMVEQALTEHPSTPWHRIVRRAAMYRFYGFSIQEWTARRTDEGDLTFADVAPRAQVTIERWDVDETGKVNGVEQRSPQTQEAIYLPRSKILYLVDDTLNDSPEGLGLFRHLVEPAQRLREYERLEGFGFETDLRGIPVVRAPLTDLNTLVADDELSDENRTSLLAPLREFIENHVRNPKLGIFLDSKTYETLDDAQRPSNVRLYDVELLNCNSQSFAEHAAAIERLNREIARILGVEQLLLGADSAGSYALSHDKTSSFYLLVDGSLTSIREQVETDLVKTLFMLNGWPEEMMPEIGTEAVRFTDVEAVASALRDMATSGAPLMPDHPAVGEVYDLMGLTRPDQDQLQLQVDAELARQAVGENGPIPKEEEVVE